MAKGAKHSHPEVLDGDEETIHVTPDRPLIVNSTPVNYPSVSIEGGDIQVAIQASVTIGTLTKVS